MIPQAPGSSSPSRSRALKSSPRMLRALQEQSVDATVQFLDTVSTVFPPDGRRTAAGGVRDNSILNTVSPRDRPVSRHGISPRNEIRDEKQSSKYDRRQDDEQERDEEIPTSATVKDTSWFITKEEIMAYFRKVESRQGTKTRVNPTEAIFQHKRKHRGWTIFKKSPHPNGTETEKESLICTSITEESSSSPSKRPENGAILSASDQLFNRPKPRMPGPVLTYKQIEELYKGKRKSEEPSPLKQNSPKQGTKTYVKHERKQKTPKTAPITPNTPFSNGVVRRKGVRSIKPVAAEYSIAYVEHVNLIKSALTTGQALPIFSLYFDVDEDALQTFLDDVDPSSSFAHLQAENISMIKDLRKALMMQNVGDDASLLMLKQKSASGMRVLRQRQRQLEQNLIIRCLDFLSMSDIIVLCDVSKPWAAAAYLKLYTSDEQYIMPRSTSLYLQYRNKVLTGTLRPKINEPGLPVVDKNVSPQMISVFLKQYVEVLHGVNIFLHKKIVSDRPDSSRSTANKSHRPSFPVSPKKYESKYFENLSHIRPFPFMTYIFSDLQKQVDLGSSFLMLRKLTLASVILDENSVSELSLLHNLECITLYLVKIRVGGLFENCHLCKTQAMLSDMLFCETCCSSQFPYCSAKCRRSDNPNHTKECPFMLKMTNAFSSSRKQKAAKYNTSSVHESYFDEDLSDLPKSFGVKQRVIDQGNRSRSAWLDGHFLGSLFRSLSQTVTSVSVTYVLPSDPHEAKEIEESFQTSNLFDNFPNLSVLHIREVHESLLSTPVDHELEKFCRHFLHHWHAVKAFSQKNLFEVAVNCPKLSVLDICGNHHSGILLPIQVTLEILKSLATGCPNLGYIGYFSAKHHWENLSCVLFLDEKNRWHNLSAVSWLSSPHSMNEVLCILSGKTMFREQVNAEISKFATSTHDVFTSTSRDEIDEDDGLVHVGGKEIAIVSQADDNSSSTSESADEEQEKLQEIQGEVEFDAFVLHDNRDNLLGRSPEDVGDDISYLRHFISIVTKEIKSKGILNEYPEFKTLLLSRKLLKIGLLTELEKKCAFWPHNNSGCTFYVMLGKIISHGSVKAIVTTNEPLDDEYDRFDCIVSLTRCLETLKILAVSEIQQPAYYVAALKILKVFCSENLSSERKLVIKFTVDLKSTLETTSFGFSSVINALASFEYSAMMKMNLNSEMKGQIGFTLGEGAEDLVVSKYAPIENLIEGYDRAFELGTYYPINSIYCFNRLREMSLGLRDPFFATYTYDHHIYLTLLRPPEQAYTGLNIISSFRRNSSSASDMKQHTEKPLSQKSTSTTNDSKLPFYNCGVFRVGPIKISFDPKRRAKQKERQALRLDLALKKVVLNVSSITGAGNTKDSMGLNTTNRRSLTKSISNYTKGATSSFY